MQHHHPFSPIAVIGLGYVGLPLAVLLSKKYEVLGYDLKAQRIEDLKRGIDDTLELNKDALLTAQNASDSAIGLFLSNDESILSKARTFIITVPTPVDKDHQPDLTPIIAASRTVGKYLGKDGLVIYESTVYPGLTEEICVPILEKESGLIFNEDFFVGYSPERINPGDKQRTIEKILKITSGSTPEAAERVDALYASVIEGGTYKASSIKIAEAAKVIENAQRDINIAFVNELAKIFNKLNIPTQEVLAAAATKWNFQPYKPGLAGGHCIGVDPYYLALKAKKAGYYPGLILAARRLNESMSEYIAAQVVKCMIQKDIAVKGAELLMLGATFKENCPDLRNSKIAEVVSYLEEYGIEVTIYDPWVSAEESQREINKASIQILPHKKFDAIVLGVAHKQFLELPYTELKKDNAIVYDVKGFLPFEVDGRL